jgi:hypothetical protein
LIFQQKENVGDLILPEVAAGATHVYHLYVVRTKQRDDLQDYLHLKQIGTLIHYTVSSVSARGLCRFEFCERKLSYC